MCSSLPVWGSLGCLSNWCISCAIAGAVQCSQGLIQAVGDEQPSTFLLLDIRTDLLPSFFKHASPEQEYLVLLYGSGAVKHFIAQEQFLLFWADACPKKFATHAFQLLHGHACRHTVVLSAGCTQCVKCTHCMQFVISVMHGYWQVTGGLLV